MKEKFVRALLNECDNEEEIDQVFELIKENDIQKRCDFLIEKDCQYFDLPKEPDGARWLVSNFENNVCSS